MNQKRPPQKLVGASLGPWVGGTGPNAQLQDLGRLGNRVRLISE